MTNDKKAKEPQDNSENEDNDSEESNEVVIPEELEPVLKDLPEEKRKAIAKAIIGFTFSQSSSFRGPLPPPELLDGYNSVVDNGAERIVSMAEKQSDHRIRLEDHAIKEELKQSRHGQVFGFILGILGLLLATLLAILGHETIAGIFGTTTIVGLVAVFVIGRKAQQADLEEKK